MSNSIAPSSTIDNMQTTNRPSTGMDFSRPCTDMDISRPCTDMDVSRPCTGMDFRPSTGQDQYSTFDEIKSGCYKLVNDAPKFNNDNYQVIHDLNSSKVIMNQ